MKTIMKKNQLMITALAIMIAIAGYLQFAENTMDGGQKSGNALEVDSGHVITERYQGQELSEGDSYNLALDGLLDLSEEDLYGLTGDMMLGETGYADNSIASLDTDLEFIQDDYLDENMEIADAGQTEDVPAGATLKEGVIPGEAVFTSAGAVPILEDARLLKEQTRAKNKETLLSVLGNEFLSEEQKQTAVSSMVEMTQIAEKETSAEILLEAKGFSDVVVSISGNGADVVVNAAALSEAQIAQIEDIVSRKAGVPPENIIISTVVRE